LAGQFRPVNGASDSLELLFRQKPTGYCLVFADGFGHLKHIQSGFSKDWFQLFIGYDLRRFFGPAVMLLNVRQPSSQPVVGIWGG